MKGDKKEAYITTNDGVRIAYERFGSEEGPIVVLLHGACRCQIGYDSVARQSVHCNVQFFLIPLFSLGRLEWLTALLRSECARALKVPSAQPLICLLGALSPEGHRLKGPAHATVMTVHSKALGDW